MRHESHATSPRSSGGVLHDARRIGLLGNLSEVDDVGKQQRDFRRVPPVEAAFRSRSIFRPAAAAQSAKTSLPRCAMVDTDRPRSSISRMRAHRRARMVRTSECGRSLPIGLAALKSLRALAEETDRIQSSNHPPGPPVRRPSRDRWTSAGRYRPCATVARRFSACAARLVEKMSRPNAAFKLGGPATARCCFPTSSTSTEITEKPIRLRSCNNTSRYFAAMSHEIMTHAARRLNSSAMPSWRIWNAPADDPDHAAHACAWRWHFSAPMIASTPSSSAREPVVPHPGWLHIGTRCRQHRLGRPHELYGARRHVNLARARGAEQEYGHRYS